MVEQGSAEARLRRSEEFKVSGTTLSRTTSDAARGSVRMRYPSEFMQSSLGGTKVSFHGAYRRGNPTAPSEMVMRPGSRKSKG
jgi:hypothetical protein